MTDAPQQRTARVDISMMVDDDWALAIGRAIVGFGLIEHAVTT